MLKSKMMQVVRLLVTTKPRVRLWQCSRWAEEKVTGRKEQRRRGQGIGEALHVDAEITHQGGKSRNEEGKSELGFPGGAVVESLPANAGDTGSSPGLGRSHMPRSN